MAIVINGSGTVTGISVGGLPDDIVDSGTLASDALDSAVTINDTGADVDFRVESDDDANIIFVDGGNDSVGIGTSSPHSGAKLHIVDGAGTVPTMTAGDVLTIQNNDATDDNAGFTSIAGTAGVSYINFGDSGDKNIGGLNYYHSDNSLGFFANAVKYVVIESTGVLSSEVPAGASKTNMNFRNGGAQKGSIVTSDYSNNTTYNTTSDYRLKENIVDMSGAITRLKTLQPRRFNFKANTDLTMDGFIAHEVSDTVPEAITGAKDATETYTDDEGIEQTRIAPQGIDQSKLVPILVGALQEAIARIETLENA